MGVYIGVMKGLHRGLYKDYIGIMEKKLETTIWGFGIRMLLSNCGPG